MSGDLSHNENIFLRISNFFIEQPTIKWLVLLSMVVLAVLRIPYLQRYSLPRVDLKELYITTVYPGASPKEVEVEVTFPLEKQISSIDGVETYRSISSENLSYIYVYIDKKTKDVERVKRDLRTAIESTILPDLAKKPVFSEIKIDNIPVLEVGFTSESLSLLKLSQYVRSVRKDILQLPVVSKVESDGLPEREIHILLDQKKLKRKRVSILEVVDAIKKAEERVYSGTITKHNKKLNIITISSFKNPKKIKNIIIKAANLAGAKSLIRVKDVATSVEWAAEKQNEAHRYNGQTGIGLKIIKKGQKDVIESSDIVQKFLNKEELKLKDAGADIKLHYHVDDAFDTRVKLSIVYKNMWLGFIFVLIILSIFLSRTIAFWTTFAMPVVVTISLGIASLLNVSINAISLCGVIVSLGILVDDAVVIGESIFFYRQRGFSAVESSKKGLRRVLRPMFFSVLTTVVGFMSMAFIEGTVGEFSIEIPIMVSIMLTASLFETVVFLPSNLSHVKLSEKKPLGDHFFYYLQVFYKKTLGAVLNHYILAIIFFVVSLILVLFIAIQKSHFDLFPPDKAFHITFNGEFIGSETLSNRTKEIKKIEKIIDSLPQGTVRTYKTTVGGGHLKNAWKIDVYLVPYYKRSLMINEVKDFVFSEIEKKKKEINVALLNYNIDDGGPPLGKPVEITVVSNNGQKRVEIAKKIAQDLKDMGLSEVDTNLRDTTSYLVVKPKDEAYFFHLSAREVAQTLRVAFEGMIAETIDEGGEQIGLRVQLDHEKIDFKNPLKDITIVNKAGLYVPVKKIVEVKTEKSLALIHHENGVRQNKVTARFDTEKMTILEVYQKLKKKYTPIDKAEDDLKIIIGGKAKKSSGAVINLLMVLGISVLAVYTLLIFQFRRLVHPFIISMAMPYGIAGILIMFSLQGKPISLIATTGIIGFVGVVVNAAIVMVDFINSYLAGKKEQIVAEKGENAVISREVCQEMVIKGASERLRPIFITTITTLGGLVPTAYGFLSETDPSISPIAMAMVWGLVFGTSASLYLVPLFYFVSERISSFFWENKKKKMVKS